MQKPQWLMEAERGTKMWHSVLKIGVFRVWNKKSLICRPHWWTFSLFTI